MTKTNTTTKYYSGDIELRGYYSLPHAVVREQFPAGKIKKYDDFNLLVGTIDGKYSESSFLPVTRIINYNPQGSQHKCDGRCLNAKRGDCECSCGNGRYQVRSNQMTMTTEQPRTQTFYCKGCQEYHEVESLLEAARWESVEIEKEKNNDSYKTNSTN
jgi:hypothetical protein